MNLLKSELMEHQKVLDAFQGLPRDIKKHILTFHNSKDAFWVCAECFRRSYKILVYENDCFVCEHRAYCHDEPRCPHNEAVFKMKLISPYKIK